MPLEPLTVGYLEDRRSMVHNYESFGRSIAELMLQEARHMVLAKETEANPRAIEFKADVVVSAIEPTGAVAVEICVRSIGCSKVHVTPG